MDAYECGAWQSASRRGDTKEWCFTFTKKRITDVNVKAEGISG